MRSAPCPCRSAEAWWSRSSASARGNCWRRDVWHRREEIHPAMFFPVRIGARAYGSEMKSRVIERSEQRFIPLAGHHSQGKVSNPFDHCTLSASQTVIRSKHSSTCPTLHAPHVHDSRKGSLSRKGFLKKGLGRTSMGLRQNLNWNQLNGQRTFFGVTRPSRPSVLPSCSLLCQVSWTRRTSKYDLTCLKRTTHVS